MLTPNTPLNFAKLLQQFGVISWQASGDRQNTLLPLPGTNTEQVNDWFSIVHPNDVDALRSKVNAIKESGSYQAEYRIKHTESKCLWVREIAKLKDNDENQIEGYLYSIEEIKSLEESSIEAAENEKRKLGRELHDDLCQQLVGMLFFTNNLLHQINSGKDKEALVDSAVEIKNQLLISIDKTKSISKGLNPVNLEFKPFEECLLDLIDQFKTLYSTKCSLDISPDINFNNQDTATHLFRIIQEGINNAIRHGRANSVTITLQRQNDTGILVIKDNGSGIKSSESQSSGMGLHNLNFRALSIGATLKIENHPSGGVQLQCKIPLSLL